MEHVVDAGHRRTRRIVIEDVAVLAFDVQVVDGLRRTGLTEQYPDVVAALYELPFHVETEEAARPDHHLLCSAMARM
jgi:hypothetical protein